MKNFYDLLKLADKLLGPSGCPWDKEQTLFSLQKYLIEETYEVVQAIDYQNTENLKEELGDLLYNIVFISKLGKISMDEIIDLIAKKIIRRHPHIFENLKLETAADVKEQWDKIKKNEIKTLEEKHNFIDKQLPLLMRAQKMIKQMNGSIENLFEKKNEPAGLENSLAIDLLRIIFKAEKNNIQIEDALRRLLIKIEKPEIDI